MNSFTIYHNPRCSKSRQTLALLQEHGIEAQQILYLEKPPSTKELKTLLEWLGIGARDLLRKGEDAYKELGLADTSLPESALIKAMHEHPKLIERPIVVLHNSTGKTRAVLGRPPENVLELISTNSFN